MKKIALKIIFLVVLVLIITLLFILNESKKERVQVVHEQSTFTGWFFSETETSFFLKGNVKARHDNLYKLYIPYKAPVKIKQEGNVLFGMSIPDEKEFSAFYKSDLFSQSIYLPVETVNFPKSEGRNINIELKIEKSEWSKVPFFNAKPFVVLEYKQKNLDYLTLLFTLLSNIQKHFILLLQPYLFITIILGFITFSTLLRIFKTKINFFVKLLFSIFLPIITISNTIIFFVLLMSILLFGSDSIPKNNKVALAFGITTFLIGIFYFLFLNSAYGNLLSLFSFLLIFCTIVIQLLISTGRVKYE